MASGRERRSAGRGGVGRGGAGRRGAAGVRRVLGVVVGYGFRAAPGAMALSLTLVLGGAAASVSYPVGFKIMTDAFLTHDQARMVAGIGVVAVLFSLSWVLVVVGGVQGAALTGRVNLFVTARLATLVNDSPGIEHFERPDHLADLDELREKRRMLAGGPQQALTLAQMLATIGGIVGLLATVDPLLGLLPLVAVPPLLGDNLSVRIRERSDRAVAEAQRLADELFRLSSTAEPAKEVRVYGLSDLLAARYAALARRIRRARVRAATLGALVGALGWVVYAAGFSGAIALVAYRAAHGETSIGQVVLAVTLVRRAQLQVSRAADTVGQFATTTRAARRLIDVEDRVLRETGATVGAPTPRPVPERLTRGIALEGVDFRYPGTDEDVLTGVDLVLPAGTTVALVGENGAGKTTLVKLLTGMYRPDSGTVRIDGTDLAEVDLAAWRARTSAVFQDFVSFHLLAREVVGIGDLPRAEDLPAVERAMERAHAADVVPGLARGLDTPLGRTFSGGSDLSGGQWQKLALSRGMMRDAPLLLVLDEPTASLDAGTESALFERYAAAARRTAAEVGAITLLVSHRFSTVRMADLIVVLQDGRVREIGDHDTLMTADGLYAELFSLQARAYR